MTPEGKVKASLRELFKKFNVLQAAIPQNGMGGSPGYPDYVAYTANGTHFVVECKAGKGKLTPLQELWKKKLTERKVPYFLFSEDPLTRETLTNFLLEDQKKNN